MEGTCTNQPYLVLMQTSNAIHERIRLEMHHNKISITEFSVLEVLYLKGKQTIQQIGKSILISSGSMTYVIDKLEQKGLLNRKEGIELMKKIMPNQRELVNHMFGSLNEHESQTMVKLLKKVGQRIET
jgi:MarR family 2-MHQ and catechol resistance regulon transcriptional repressor